MPTQWSEAEQVPLGCIAPPFCRSTPCAAPQGRTTLSALMPRQRCHSEPVTDVTGVGIRSPRPQARNSKAFLVQREVSWPKAMTEGLFASASCPVIPSQSADWRGNPFPFSLPPAASFLSAAKEKRKRNAAKNYVFGFPYAPSPAAYLACFTTRTLCRGNFP